MSRTRDKANGQGGENVKRATIIFPHQLFEKHPAINRENEIFLVEEFLFFQQYNFHKQKLMLHRSTMKFYEAFLKKKGLKVNYLESADERSDVRNLVPHLIERGFEEIHVCDVSDDWLEKRIKKHSKDTKIIEFPTPLFLNSKTDLENYFAKPKKKYFQTKFYKGQRKKLGILLEDGSSPAGGKWSFDSENRKKYPKKKIPPKVVFPDENSFVKEAKVYVENEFPENYGEINSEVRYPGNFEESRAWFTQFLEKRFSEFGAYEDAIVRDEHILNHSLLSPLMNVGLLRPSEIIESSIEFAEANDIPLNSLEGFVRQIIGWREFLRGVYEFAGSKERTMNYWEFKRKIPKSFWTAETGIEPLDITIEKVLKTGYCHHIERLMILGNFMLLCEFDPDEVYRWFMELFVDSYDWVMVPNVYGMSQFADGGMLATKPYISGSNYLMKMSDFKKGEWQTTWDGLFWNFMDKHRNKLKRNPRLAMLVGTFDRMDVQKRTDHLEAAKKYLESLDSEAAQHQ